ncbi:tyrosine-type recombinase/integrase [Candidatus Borrarchaeum sp.]|uniref:tyrosine-type recombinase/integrase n=1 Tax=Candidatus Borrarchaeum sp. TaxID=2846742 RepID=UPI00257C9080|nr:tyrosine-type recombinase/integrase [Candidatus Borrarchaeum sp.]
MFLRTMPTLSEDYLQSRITYLETLDSEAARLFRKFDRSKKGENVKLSTRINYIKVFVNFVEFLTNIQNKDISEVTIDDLEDYRFVMRSEDSGFFKKVSTQKSYLIQTRIILRWLMDRDLITTLDYKRFDKFKLPRREEFTPVNPEDLVTEEELRKLLQITHPRNQALLALIAKNGLAIIEALYIRKKDISIFQTHIEIRIHDKRALKTKYRKRKVMVVEAQKYLIDWINQHPLWNEENPFLFIALKKDHRNLPGRRLSYNGANDMLTKLCQRARIRKINFHLLRHGAATEAALDDMHPEMMNRAFGWKPGSRMPGIYVNVADQKFIEYEKRRKGIATEEELEELEKTKLLQPRICPRCERENSFEARLCSFCGSALDPDVIQESEGQDQVIAKLQQEIDEMKDAFDEIKSLIKK